MNQLQEALIKLTQNGLPLVEKPYQWIADNLGISQADVFSLIAEMKSEGIIRRIGAVPNHYALGYRYNLMTVWDVKDTEVETLGEKIGALEFVSHCYIRPRHLPHWPYNLFAMVHAKNETLALEKRNTIAELLGKSCKRSDILASEKILKKTGLRI